MYQLNQSCTRVKDSGIEGSGCFATREIRKGVYFIEYTGERITPTEYKIRVQKYIEQGVINYIIQAKSPEHDKRKVMGYIDATNRGNDSRFANHSCRPNSRYQSIVDEHGIQRILLMAFTDIHDGDEILIDYSKSYREHK